MFSFTVNTDSINTVITIVIPHDHARQVIPNIMDELTHKEYGNAITQRVTAITQATPKKRGRPRKQPTENTDADL